MEKETQGQKKRQWSTMRERKEEGEEQKENEED
jgi:hypothetical protein